MIYYQILRHLKVDTCVTGVRECLFVPFSLSPFTLQRAYRWRDSIAVGLRDQRYRRAVRYLPDVVTGFAGSVIPPGSRADQPVRYLHGSVFLNLGIERPKDTEDGGFDEPSWNVLKGLLGTPMVGIHSQLRTLVDALRDRRFQEEHAPRIAAAWADTLQLFIPNQVLDADFTLATRYQFNTSVRVDFTVSIPEGQTVTRQMLSRLRIRATRDLPPGSVANVTRASFTYQTDAFSRSISVSQGHGDLIVVETGARDLGASLNSVPDQWEQQDERAEIVRATQQLVHHLNENMEYYHKVIWWNMDRDRLYMLLDGFMLPSAPGVSVASVVEREPIAILGNAIVFRVSAGSFLGLDDIQTPENLFDYYVDRQSHSESLHVSLPTDGLYAQTIMDECNALEEHYGNTDWALSDKEPELGSIPPELLGSRGTTPEAITPTPFPQTLINLQNAPEAPAPSGLASAFEAITNANAFRDMAGLAGTQANTQAAFNTAASLATGFGNQAAALHLAKLAEAQEATRTADQKLASIKNAQDKGLVQPEDVQKATKATLEAMNPDMMSTEAPHQNPAINAAIQTAGFTPGSTIEATTSEGITKVSIGPEEIPVLQPQCGFNGSAGLVAEDELRRAIATAAMDELPLWRNNSGRVVKESTPANFGQLVKYWLSQTDDFSASNLEALAQAAVAAGFDYQKLTDAPQYPAGVDEPEQKKAWLDAHAASDNNVVRNKLIAAAGLPTTPLLENLIDSALRGAQHSFANLTAWSAVFVVSVIERVAMEKHLTDAPADNNVLLRATSRHANYVLEAHRRRDQRDGTYLAFHATSRAVQIGDIVVSDRQAKSTNGVWKYEKIQEFQKGGRELHGDIVVNVDIAGGYAVTVGGNVGDSVKRRRYPIDADGKLIVDERRKYAQEKDDGSLPPVPSPTSDFKDESTSRIFTILSLVPTCLPLPVRHEEIIA